MSENWREQAPAAGPVRAFEFPAVSEITLANGMRVLHARHGRLPIVSAHVVIDAGAATEPADKGGLAQLAASALHAGTTTRDGGRIAWELERLGVQLKTSADWDALQASITVPVGRTDRALDLLSDVIRNAAFPETEIERMRAEQLAEILQRLKEPRALASDVAGRCVFARDVPYARPLIGSTTSVSALRADDLRNFHSARFTPRNSAIIIVGDIAAADARALAERCFGDWQGERVAAPEFAVRPRATGTTIFVVDRPGAVQSELRVGHIGVPRGHQDYFTLLVMNTIFGGAFTSRLNMNLRERNGFTYGARSSYAFRRRPGPFLVQTAVGTDVTVRAVEEILRETERLRNEGVRDEEVDNARDYLVGVMPLQMQTTDQLAVALADLFVFELPVDYFANYRARIAAVTTADVRAAARAHLRPDELAIVVVGDARSVRAGLEALGKGPLERIPAEADAA
jgi:zinc protease